MPARSTSPFRHALAAALLLGAAACADQPTTPAAAGAPGLRRSTGEGATPLGKPVLHPNGQRYRDDGQRPATGRSGSASLVVQALLGRDGMTEVAIATGDPYRPWEQGQGNLAHVQTKASLPDGRHLFTRNHPDPSDGGRATLEYGGLARGVAVQVQANVRGIDPHRTDVVTVTTPVVRRPNLAAVSVDAPRRVRAGMWVPVSATVRETGGDLGNWGTCTLYVDGARADWSRGIWVNAGDVVTCSFTHRFETAGTHRLEVRLEDTPGALRDDDAGDNSAAAEVESFVSDDFFYSAWADEMVSRSTSYRHERWTIGSSVLEWLDDYLYDGKEQRVQMDAWLPRAIPAGALRVEISETSGGATLVACDYEIVPDQVSEDGSFFALRQDPATGAYLYLRSDVWQVGRQTSFGYRRDAGSVTYHSIRSQRTWNGETGEESGWSINEAGTREIGPGFVPFGDDFALRLRVHAGDGVFGADPAFTFTRSESQSESPYACWSWSYAPDWISETCAGGSSYFRYARGNADG
ncbi:MAG TPA: hypothetical protein VFR81_17335 [Longimicrobium sp.]|nr:hypothetical protein [Longimicrobium sp.]